MKKELTATNIKRVRDTKSTTYVKWTKSWQKQPAKTDREEKKVWIDLCLLQKFKPGAGGSHL
jgi:hypothetical protein